MVVVGVLGVGQEAWSQSSAGATSPDAGVVSSEDQLVKDSPRASLSRFLDLCRAGDYARAARYLDLPPTDANRGPELAQHLKSVLDRYAWFDLDTISPLPGGNVDDGLHLGKLAAFSDVSAFPVRVKCASLAWHTLNAAMHETTTEPTSGSEPSKEP